MLYRGISGVVRAGTYRFARLFSSLFLLNRLVWKQAIKRPLAEGRARNSVVGAFTDNLLRHNRPVFVVLAVLVFLDKSYHIPGGVMESRLCVGALIVAIFVARQVIRKR
ncbi:MAG: hypothetical protein ABI972_09125 [Acidobacteriota bacterium]